MARTGKVHQRDGSMVPYLRRPALWQALPASAAATAPRARRTSQRGHHVHDGDLDVPGRPRIIPTPGHSPGHVAFHLPELGVLIAGDALCTYNAADRQARPAADAQGVRRRQPADARLPRRGRADRRRAACSSATASRGPGPAEAVAAHVRSGSRDPLSWTSAEVAPLEHGHAHFRAPPRGRRAPTSPPPRRGGVAAAVRCSASSSRSSRSPRSCGGRSTSPRRSCPDTPAEIAALLGAIALYALATVVRGERWQRLLERRGRHAAPQGHARAQRDRLHGQQRAARPRRGRDPRRPDGAAGRRRPSARCVGTLRRRAPARRRRAAS